MAGSAGGPGAAARPEQLGLAGMPRRLFPATPSKLTTFTSCPRRYYLTYLLRPAPPKGPPWAHNSMGAAVHNALREWWLLPPPRRTPTAGGAALAAGWITEGFRDAEQSARWRDRARDWVEGYLASVDPADEPVGLERQIAMRTSRLALSGRVDRIDARGDEVVIVDYKTGRWVPNTDDARGSVALAVYALGAARTLRRPCHQVELHHLPTGQVVTWRHTDESLGRHVSRAEQVADDIVAGTDTVEAGADPDDVFPPQPGTQCGWCDLRRHCPTGQAAQPDKAPWAGLPVEPA
ncbi:MAG TPA: PD-(D/E)XK nuclease family protein [Mycobacteriales bacterium]|nr:PD-(D/E)XK nuclease family protein [Mycobacteriales bacterium]